MIEGDSTIKLICVGIGGFIGATLRYEISLGAIKLIGDKFPYGTLIVNIIGCVLIGFIMELSLKTNLISDHLKLFLTTGVMGGLTTFSTFSYETVTLFENGKYLLSIYNVLLNMFLSILGVIVGQFLCRLILYKLGV